MRLGLALAPMLSADLNIGVDGYLEYEVFGQKLYLTDTHICLVLVILTLVIFGLFANRAIKRADPYKAPGTFLCIVEYLVTLADNMVIDSMGKKHGPKFANYIGTLFAFILLSNISGLFGLRPPTADYGVTLALGMITFLLIHYNGFKYQKLGHITGLFKPIPILFPINLVGEIANPLSISLRLFGNVLSGTVMMAVVYALVPKVLLMFGWTSFLHIYFDVFSGAIQTYVFCMLSMVYISDAIGEEE